MRSAPVVIIGGGPAGVAAALELDRLIGDRLDVPIYLFDTSPNHVYAPRVFDLLRDGARGVYQIPYTEIFEGTRVRFFCEAVTSVDFDLKRITTEKRQVTYGDVVLAVGADVPKHKGSEPWLVHTVQDVTQVKGAVQAIAKQHQSQSRKHYVSIVGGGLRGVEAAFAVTSLLNREHRHHPKSFASTYVTLVQSAPRVAPEMSREVSTALASLLKHVGVSVQTKKRREWNDHTAAQPKKDDSPWHSAVWAIGLSPREVSGTKTLRRGADGRFLVESTLRLHNQKNAWAVGGCASVAEPVTVTAAWRQGIAVARSLVKERENEPAAAYYPAPASFFMPISDKAMVRITHDTVQAGFWIAPWAYLMDFYYLLRLVPVYQAADLVLKRGGM